MFCLVYNSIQEFTIISIMKLLSVSQYEFNMYIAIYLSTLAIMLHSYNNNNIYRCAVSRELRRYICR